MKRSQLRRGKPLKRSPMRATRKVPRFQDPGFRRDYKEANPDDEWNQWLGFSIPTGPDDSRWFMPNELNHLATNPRRDALPFVITLSKRHHDWFHENINAGRVLCLLVKCRKGEDDLAGWNKALGKNVLGWVKCLDFWNADYHWMLAYRDELLVRLLELERRAA